MSAFPEYGSWALDNADCIARAELGMGVKTFGLCWCIVCACQAFFFAIRYPNVSWEYILVPAAQALTYGLGYSGVGYIQLADGRIICWTRPAMWLVTVPTILMQINAMGSFKFISIDVNSLQISISLLMIVSGFSASVAHETAIKWMFFVFGSLCLILIFLVTHGTFMKSLARFTDAGTPNAMRVALRLKILYGLFFPSWAVYPLLYILSLEGACVAEENVIIVCFILADAVAKNIFGIILWDIVWNILGGRWDLAGDEDGKGLMEEGKSTLMSPPPNSTAAGPHPHSLVQQSLNQTQTQTQSLNPEEKELQADMVLRPGALALPAPPPYPPAPPPAYPAYPPSARADVEMSTPAVQAIQLQAALQRRANSPADLVSGGLPGVADSGGWGPRRGSGVAASGSGGRGGRMAVDEVVDHVRNLNQALSDLLVYDSLSPAPPLAPAQPRFEDMEGERSSGSPPYASAVRLRALSPPRR